MRFVLADKICREPVVKEQEWIMVITTRLSVPKDTMDTIPGGDGSVICIPTSRVCVLNSIFLPFLGGLPSVLGLLTRLFDRSRVCSVYRPYW